VSSKDCGSLGGDGVGGTVSGFCFSEAGVSSLTLIVLLQFSYIRFRIGKIFI
jgi:hypothetical protein